MSGNICAATNSPSPCSKATTTSSTNPAPPGASSPTTPNASPQSHPEPGRRSFLEAVGIMPADIDSIELVFLQRVTSDRQRLALGAGFLDPVIAAAGTVAAVADLGDNA